MEQLFPKRLREVREETGLSQADFASKIGISRASLSYYENGTRTPDIYLLRSIHEATGVSVYYLLGITDTKNDNFFQLQKDTGLSERALSTLCSFTDLSKNGNYLTRNIMLGINQMIENDTGLDIIYAIHDYLRADFSNIYTKTSYNSENLSNGQSEVLIDTGDEGVKLVISSETIEMAYISNIVEAIRKWKEELKHGKETPEQ